MVVSSKSLQYLSKSDGVNGSPLSVVRNGRKSSALSKKNEINLISITAKTVKVLTKLYNCLCYKQVRYLKKYIYINVHKSNITDFYIFDIYNHH